MTSKISLSVNGTPIKLDYFVAGFLDNVTAGIIASLKNTSEIRQLELKIDGGQVTINLNGASVPLGYFATEIVRSTVSGMVAPLKGVDGAVRELELKIEK